MRSKLTAALAAITVALGTSMGAVTLLSSPAEAAGPPADIPGVPHYFGPYPNWALSPLTTSTAVVTVNDIAGGAGAGATASAVIDPVKGGIQSVTVLTPGSGYSAGATATVTGSGSGAALSVAVNPSGGVTGFVVDPATGAGAGYGGFSVVVAPPAGVGTTATAEATGGVDAVGVVTGGAGYTAPTVEFDLPTDPNGKVAKGHAVLDGGTCTPNAAVVPPVVCPGVVTSVVVDSPGSGYTTAPTAAVHNGTLMDPIAGATIGTFTTTLKLQAVNPIDLGTGYTSAPAVTITDSIGTGTGAAATAVYATGGIQAITVNPGANGTGYLTKGIKKFQDPLPVTCTPAVSGGCPKDSGATKIIPIAVPEKKTYTDAKGVATEADEIVIGLVQYRTQFNKDLPPTLVRGYVQIETPAQAAISEHFPLTNELLDGTKVPVTGGYLGVTAPQWLGPFINATKDRPVRVVFRNLLPTGKDGDLFLPVDSTMMGSGMGDKGGMAPPPVAGTPGVVTDTIRNPECTASPKPDMCFKDNRATLHLHGGMSPWISDGTPHQWITPAGDTGSYPQGVSVQNVPDMKDAAGATLCEANNDGCSTFYYTNQQSARLMFYHDHSWGITRLNVYAGEAAGYSITDATEQALVKAGTIPAAADTIPLIVQDRTFTPEATQLAAQDPTWNSARWGENSSVITPAHPQGTSSLWYHHVYMPAQNPGDPSGMSAYGRWMYGPWFWPPAAGTVNGPIANPYYDPGCSLGDPATWQYQVDPFCEPAQIPGTPNISAGMEQFNDTPVVNGVAYPTVTLDPKTYRFRMLNAANDRFFNFQWYTADPTQGDGTTEVALKPADLAAAQTDPTISPNPVDSNSTTAGPDWVQIGNESGFLATPAVIDGQQPTTWITDPTRFDVGNVDKHSMLLAPAERSDAIVDFSKFAGKTLILYNDAPAAFPARVPSYDYYTGQPDLSPNGAPGVLPGYGPNTRTVMQVKIAAKPAAPAFSTTKLTAAFNHKANGTGVFESGQPPIIVGQSAYNSAYGTSFPAGANCNAPVNAATTCDGFVRINDTTNFGFNTLKTPLVKSTMPLQPKAIHDEMNSSTFDEFGRMQANLGVEAQPPTPGAQNVTLYPFVNPQTELIDGTSLQKATDKLVPISNMKDGTQIWRITHNGVDTHPIHFHLFDVQVLNRVTWDNIILAPDPQELGWKDTVRTSPLEDTIVALRPVVPQVPFEVPNSVRSLSPMDDPTSTKGFNNIDPAGAPTAAIVNKLVNYGWEYVFHCHILSHEEMDMMRPVSLALPPNAPDGAQTYTDAVTGNLKLVWNDNSITETAFRVESSATPADPLSWASVGQLTYTLGTPNLHELQTMDLGPAGGVPAGTVYRVIADNTVGYGGAFPSVTASSPWSANSIPMVVPDAPTGLTATVASGPTVNLLWVDNSTTESSFTIERATDGVTFTPLATVPANTVTYTDPTANLTVGTTYTYRVAATNLAGNSVWSNLATAAVIVPTAPVLSGALAAGPSAALTWTAATGHNSYLLERSTDAGVNWSTIATPAAAAVSYTDTPLVAGNTYLYRLTAVNFAGNSAPSTATVAVTPPDAATGLSAAINGTNVDLVWTLPLTGAPADTQSIERSTDGGATWTVLAPAPAVTDTAYTDTTTAIGSTYTYRVGRTNLAGTTYSATAVATFVPSAPTGLTATLATGPTVNLAWTNPAGALTGVIVERATGAGAFTVLTTLATAPTTYSDPTATPDATYSYRVSATNTAGTSVPSAVASVDVIRPVAPSTPTVALTSTLATGPQATITWTDNATTETGFSVERSSDAGLTWSNIGSPTANAGTGAMSFVDTAPVSGTTYRYRVGAVNLAGASYSAMSAAVVVILPVAPTNFTYTLQAAPTRVRLAWVDASTNENGFVIQRSANGGTTWTQLTVQGASGGTGSNRNWTDTTAVLGTTYQYRVAARNANGLSFTPTLTVAVAAPPAPTITSAVPGVTSATREQIVINWTAVPLATSGYTVQWSTTAGLPVTGSVNVSAAATVNTRTNLLRQVWYVRVGSRNALGTTYSAWVAVPAA